MDKPTHIPVLQKEAIKALNVHPWGRFIDCTVGGGGHAAAIMEHSQPGGQLLGIDADPEAIKTAQARLQIYGDSVKLVNDNFVNLASIYQKYNAGSPLRPNGILFDLGLSSLQLEDSIRGFSFQNDGPLDMRFSPNQKLTAAEIINNYSEAQIARVIWTYGEEAKSRRIAHQIVSARPVTRTLQLAQIVEQAVGRRDRRIHPATRMFQALRIAVNHELTNLESALKQAIGILEFGGRLVVISYHSLEDRIVKRFLQRETKDCVCPPETPKCICEHKARMAMINKHVIRPTPDEIKTNPRSRSARLRAAERIRDIRVSKAWV